MNRNLKIAGAVLVAGAVALLAPTPIKSVLNSFRPTCDLYNQDGFQESIRCDAAFNSDGKLSAIVAEQDGKTFGLVPGQGEYFYNDNKKCITNESRLTVCLKGEVPLDIARTRFAGTYIYADCDKGALWNHQLGWVTPRQLADRETDYFNAGSVRTVARGVIYQACS